MIEFMATRIGYSLQPDTDADREKIQQLKQGGSFRIECYQQSQRSLQHHRLFFAMLQLTLDYWEPPTNHITSAELKALRRFTDWLERETGSKGAVHQLAKVYLEDINAKRKQRYELPEKKIDDLLKWVKLKIGHVKRIVTPDGIMLEPKSISFQSMNQEQFNDFYKKAFNACWSLVMCNHFENEQDCQRAIDQLSNMG